MNTKQKAKLTPEQQHICIERGTEAPFTGKYLHNKDKGTYNCVVCDAPLFSSSAKFDSGSGWPSFSDVLQKGTVKLEKDTSYGMVRTEVICANCDAHLGHVFVGNPQDAQGLYYCVNSAALDFVKKD